MNLLPHLTGQTQAAPHERLFWKEQARGAIREGRYKLLTGEKNAKRELYDLDADLAETKNIAAGNPDVVQRLDARWQAWNKTMAPPLWQTPPQKEWAKPEFQPLPWPEENVAAAQEKKPGSP